MTPHPALLEVSNLTKEFPVRRAFFGAQQSLRAVDNVSFTIASGETLGLVGESGCGKTTTGKLILQLEQPTRGEIRLEGQPLHGLSREAARRSRRSVQAVFQNPFASLDGRMRVGSIIGEPLVVNERLSRPELRNRVARLLDLVRLPDRALDRFPHEFSGGQRQRIAIARALALSPKIVVLDEPVAALDVSIRAQILNLLGDFQKELGLSYLFISHDLIAVAHMSHAIAVMYLGRIVEIGEAARIVGDPKHPYTKALFSAALPLNPDEHREEIILPGEVPNPLRPPRGCPFHPRCPSASRECSEREPTLRPVGQHMVACHLA